MGIDQVWLWISPPSGGLPSFGHTRCSGWATVVVSCSRCPQYVRKPLLGEIALPAHLRSSHPNSSHAPRVDLSAELTPFLVHQFFLFIFLHLFSSFVAPVDHVPLLDEDPTVTGPSLDLAGGGATRSETVAPVSKIPVARDLGGDLP